jgi:hypothetical protein
MEGNSIRATAPIVGVSNTTILKLIEDAGQAAAWYQDRVLRNLPCKRIQADEIWGFVAVKEAPTVSKPQSTTAIRTATFGIGFARARIPNLSPPFMLASVTYFARSI